MPERMEIGSGPGTMARVTDQIGLSGPEKDHRHHRVAGAEQHVSSGEIARGRILKERLEQVGHDPDHMLGDRGMREMTETHRSFAMIRLALAWFVLAIPVGAVAQHQSHSPYAGMENREIKSLSAQDIEDLRAGRGWGLALAAELNGIPGPAHLLELRDEIGLTDDQVSAIEAIFAAMQAEAQTAGERLIAAEAAIEAAFRAGDLAPEALRDLIDTAAAARAELRFIHLSRHLETPPLLTAEQIARYNELRGYGASDPCAAVPEGHDPAMWRRHNNCGN